jgi:hypothetical protein
MEAKITTLHLWLLKYFQEQPPREISERATLLNRLDDQAVQASLTKTLSTQSLLVERALILLCFGEVRLEGSNRISQIRDLRLDVGVKGTRLTW